MEMLHDFRYGQQHLCWDERATFCFVYMRAAQGENREDRHRRHLSPDGHALLARVAPAYHSLIRHLEIRFGECRYGTAAEIRAAETAAIIMGKSGQVIELPELNHCLSLKKVRDGKFVEEYRDNGFRWMASHIFCREPTLLDGQPVSEVQERTERLVNNLFEYQRDRRLVLAVGFELNASAYANGSVHSRVGGPEIGLDYGDAYVFEYGPGMTRLSTQHFAP